MKKTFTLTLIMLLTCLLSANATKKYADLTADQKIGNGTWTANSKSFAWTTQTNARMILTGLSGNISEYTSLVLEIDNYTSSFRVDFLLDGESNVVSNASTSFYNMTNKTKTITLSEKLTADQLKKVKEIRVNANSTSGSVTINKAYLSKPFTALDFNNGFATIDPTDLTASTVTFDDQTGVLTSTGNGSVSVDVPSTGIDLSDVKYMFFSYSGDNIVNNLSIKDASGSSWSLYSSKYILSFSGDNDKTRDSVTEIKWNMNSTAGSLTIKSIAFAKDKLSIPVGTSLYATFVTPVNLDFSAVTDLKAYIVKMNGNNEISYTDITTSKNKIIPAGTAFLVYASTAGTYNVPVTTSPNTLSSNALSGSVMSSTTADGTQYILAKGEQGLGWYQATSGTTIAAGKGYLVISNASTAKPFFALDGTVTGINSVKSVERRVKNQNDAVYNLSGQRVGSNYKGIVIKNGRKVMQ